MTFQSRLTLSQIPAIVETINHQQRDYTVPPHVREVHMVVNSVARVIDEWVRWSA